MSDTPMRFAPDAATLSELESLLGPEALTAQFRTLLGNLKSTRAALSARLDAPDPEEAARLAHKLAGSSAVLGLADLARSMRNCEEGARAGQAESIRAGLASLAEWQDQLQQLIAAREARQG